LQDTIKHQGLRNRLIEEIKNKGISDSIVLNAIQKIPRHWFIDNDFEHFAYQDRPFAIANEQTISQPYTVAYQSSLLHIQKGDKVLEIGTGSGYQAAILFAMGAQVYSIERHEELYTKTKNLLKKIGIPVQTFLGDGTIGLANEAPFDKILVTAGANQVPKALFNQLKIGGMLVIPLGKTIDTQEMIRVTKISNDNFKTEKFDTFKFVPLIGKNGWPEK
jgi:protein-L-isoaspartate(D-aspartate) O-methyltransferase